MNFLPAIPLSGVPADNGNGGVAVNADGTRIASVCSNEHCVYIYSAVDPAADALVFGCAGTPGSAYGQLNYPRFACFVHRNGVDTLLICDSRNHRVVEVSAMGVFLRVMAMKNGSFPWGIAYCGVGDVIAVSLHAAHAVVLLHYESGAAKPEVTIGSRGIGDGQLCDPHGVAFTADGRYILVADCWNHRVSKFSAVSAAFIAQVISNGISYPRDVLQCGDGRIAVAQGYRGSASASVVCVGEDGGLVHNSIILSASEGVLLPVALSYSPSLNGVVVKTFEGKVFLRDAWMHSNRCAWLSALAIS
jgi:hypothetical protein